jgi:hypothetical protein
MQRLKEINIAVSWHLRYSHLRLVPDNPFRDERLRREPKGQAKRIIQPEQLRLRLLDGSEYVFDRSRNQTEKCSCASISRTVATRNGVSRTADLSFKRHSRLVITIGYPFRDCGMPFARDWDTAHTMN